MITSPSRVHVATKNVFEVLQANDEDVPNSEAAEESIEDEVSEKGKQITNQKAA